jgi:hypothetical protein
MDECVKYRWMQGDVFAFFVQWFLVWFQCFSTMWVTSNTPLRETTKTSTCFKSLFFWIGGKQLPFEDYCKLFNTNISPQKEKEGPNIHLEHCSLIPLYRKKEWIIQVDLLLYQKFPLFGVVVVKNKHKMGFSLILIILPVSKWSKNLHRKCKEYKMVPVSDSFTSKKWGGIQLLFDNNYKPLLFSNKNNLQNS